VWLNENKTLLFYDKNSSMISERYESADLASVHSKLSEIFPAKAQVLELGGGTGRDAAAMAKYGYSVTYTDGSEKMISEAKELHPELTNNIHRCVLPEELAYFADNSYQAAYAMAVLMHFDEDGVYRIFNGVNRILEPNGIFFFSVSLSRPGLSERGLDHDGRWFLLLPQKWWEEIFIKTGFFLEESDAVPDGLGREGVTWLNCWGRKG
jgi:SAM-dependent methyltransferase